MKTINASDLEIGDVFAFEIKLIDREAFKVIEKINELTYRTESRNTSEKSIFQFENETKLILLKNDHHLQSHPQTFPIQF